MNISDTPIADCVRVDRLTEITQTFRRHITERKLSGWETWIDAKVKLMAEGLSMLAAEEILAEVLAGMARPLN